MQIAPDKIAHFKAGIKAAAFGALVNAGLALPLAHWLSQPVALMVLCAAAMGAAVAALTAGITKELADKADNVIYPGMHGVEFADAAFTAAGCLPVELLLLALYHGLHPLAT